MAAPYICASGFYSLRSLASFSFSLSIYIFLSLPLTLASAAVAFFLISQLWLLLLLSLLLHVHIATQFELEQRWCHRQKRKAFATIHRVHNSIKCLVNILYIIYARMYGREVLYIIYIYTCSANVYREVNRIKKNSIIYVQKLRLFPTCDSYSLNHTLCARILFYILIMLQMPPKNIIG